MALLDSQFAVLANQAANYLASGAVPKRMGNAHVNVVPYQVFATADGQLVIAVGNDGQYRRLCAILGVPEWADDVRFANNAARLAKARKSGVSGKSVSGLLDLGGRRHIKKKTKTN